GEPSRPSVKPVGGLDQDVECLLVSGELVHLPKSHQGLMKDVLGRPDRRSLLHFFKVLLGNGTDPAVAVMRLETRQFRDDVIRFSLDSFVVVRGPNPRSRRKPMPQEMSTHLTG